MQSSSKKAFKAAFRAIRVACKGETTIGEAQIVGAGWNGGLAVCSGFSDRATQIARAATGCRNDAEFLAAILAPSCFAWRLYATEHPPVPVSMRFVPVVSDFYA